MKISETDYQKWELIPAVMLVGLVALVWGRALQSTPSYDIGLAYQGGIAAWETGRPENLPTWISTSFLAAVMSVISRLFNESQIAALMSWLNIGFLALAVAVIWHQIRRHAILRPLMWWVTIFAVICYAPAVSSIWWKQINIAALLLSVLAFCLVRKNKLWFAGFVIALSILIKPLALLLPVFLFFRKETRLATYSSLAWGVAITFFSQVFLALRANDISVMNPLPALENFSDKSKPENIWVCHFENFSPQSFLCRFLGAEHFSTQRLLVIGLVIFTVALCAVLLRQRNAVSWYVFALACAVSPMISPIAWSHYQVMLLPLFIVLGIDLYQKKSPTVFIFGYLCAYALTMLIWRPAVSLPTAMFRIFDGRSETLETSIQVMSIAMFAQYVLLLVSLIWLAYTTAPVLSLRPSSKVL